MGSLVELIISFLDLAEAEAKAFRGGVMKLGLILVLLSLVCSMLLAGVGLIIWAIYLYLRTGLPPRASALLGGVIVLIITGVLIWVTKRTAR